MNKPGFRNRIFITAVIILAALTFSATSCSILKRDKQSVAEKKQKENDKKASAEYEKARKQHYDHQSKEAKKMMKKTKKDAAKYNKPLRRKGLNKTKCN
jgi:hypothetical protein